MSTATYLVFTPAGGTALDDRARFVPDHFSKLAFLFPAIWLFVQRQWLAGLIVFILQAAIAGLMARDGGMLPGLIAEIALRLAVSLEGPSLVASSLRHAGWSERAAIVADSLPSAEEHYARAMGEDLTVQNPGPAVTLPHGRTEQTAPAFGLFGSYGER